MYIVALEYSGGGIGFYTGLKKGEPIFESGGGSTKYALKYKTFSRADCALKKLRDYPKGKQAKLFIMPEDVYVAYEEWFDRRAIRLRKDKGIE